MTCFSRALPSGFGSLPHYLEVKAVTVCISEESLKEKRKKVRGSLNQVQTMTLISSEPLEKMIPDRPRSRYPGSTRGNCVAWVNLSPNADIWTMPVSEKADLYGHRIIGNDSQSAEGNDERKPSEIEPTFFNFLPRVYYEDLLATYSVAAWYVQRRCFNIPHVSCHLADQF